MAVTNSLYEAWRWQQFLDQLDKAGYALVKKPTTKELERGRPHAGGS